MAQLVTPEIRQPAEWNGYANIARGMWWSRLLFLWSPISSTLPSSAVASAAAGPFARRDAQRRVSFTVAAGRVS